MSGEVHISSLVVQAHPTALPVVRRGIEALEGAEVHGVSAAGKLVVTLETANEAGIVEHLARIHELQGVLSAVLVFHQIEPLTPTEGG